jgi:uncharacterized tellurite resistance protein B-like protein
MLVGTLPEILWRKAVVSRGLRKLSDDPSAMAQILLLFRLVLVDGIVGERELEAFETICAREFGIQPHELPSLHDLLESPKGQAVETQLFFLLRKLDGPARCRMMEFMQELADACEDDTDQAIRLVSMTARLLAPEPEEA